MRTLEIKGKSNDAYLRRNDLVLIHKIEIPVSHVFLEILAKKCVREGAKILNIYSSGNNGLAEKDYEVISKARDKIKIPIIGELGIEGDIYTDKLLDGYVINSERVENNFITSYLINQKIPTLIRKNGYKRIIPEKVIEESAGDWINAGKIFIERDNKEIGFVGKISSKDCTSCFQAARDFTTAPLVLDIPFNTKKDGLEPLVKKIISKGVCALMIDTRDEYSIKLYKELKQSSTPL